MEGVNWSENTFFLVREGIRIAGEAFSTELSEGWEAVLEQRIRDVGAAHETLESGNLNIVIFHTKVPKDAGAVQAPDIRGVDHNQIDYESLIEVNVRIALKTNPRARVFLMTDQTFLPELAIHERLNISRLKLNQREPMFERVLTMAAYVRSVMFDQPTIFLDSDAFLLRPIHNIFMNRFDVGLTHRNIWGQMPINEGVIFANNIDVKRVQKFFNAYLSTYLTLESDPRIGEIYKNIRRWRGGQLSLNSMGSGGLVYSTGHRESTEARVAFLPCSTHNLSEVSEDEVDSNLLMRAAVLHLKGLRKNWVNRITKAVNLR